MDSTGPATALPDDAGRAAFAGVLSAIAGGLIVSSQVMNPRSPLGAPETLARLALAAELGGAVGFRVDGAATVAALRRGTQAPILAIAKSPKLTWDTYITAYAADVAPLVDAGASMVAAQATVGSRPAETFAGVVAAAHEAGVPIMADIATFDEAVAAVAAGADAVGTTMVGFTPATEGAERPPLDLVRRLVAALDVPVIVEGGLWTPAQVAASFEAGAHAVVAGAAVTAPDLIAARLCAATPARS